MTNVLAILALSCTTPSGWTARADFHRAGVWSVVETRGNGRIEQIVRPALFETKADAAEELARRCAEEWWTVS